MLSVKFKEIFSTSAEAVTSRNVARNQSTGPNFLVLNTQGNTGLCHCVASVRKTSVVDIK